MAKIDTVTLHPSNHSRPNPILFVHGAFHGAWAWEEYFLPYFADKGYEVHALNWRGHGKKRRARTTAVESDYRLC